MTILLSLCLIIICALLVGALAYFWFITFRPLDGVFTVTQGGPEDETVVVTDRGRLVFRQGDDRVLLALEGAEARLLPFEKVKGLRYSFQNEKTALSGVTDHREPVAIRFMPSKSEGYTITLVTVEGEALTIYSITRALYRHWLMAPLLRGDSYLCQPMDERSRAALDTLVALFRSHGHEVALL